jgi:hypothetical protein
MEYNGPYSCSLEPAAEFYPEPDELRQYPHI